MGHRQKIRVGVSPTIHHDALIGIDFADCPLMVAEVYKQLNVAMVTTRAGSKEQKAQKKWKLTTTEVPKEPKEHLGAPTRRRV